MIIPKILKGFLWLVFTVLFALAGFNMVTNPFGLFPFTTWASYEMTQNPRIAKIDHIHKDDRIKLYVVGSSEASGFRPEDLKEASGQEAYNLFYPRAHVDDICKTVSYLVNEKEPQTILWPLAIPASGDSDPKGEGQPPKDHYLVSGENPFLFYAKLIFADPRYGVQKLKMKSQDSYFPQDYDRFLPEFGTYDNILKDSQPLVATEHYPLDPSAFSVPQRGAFSRDSLEATLEGIENVRDLCEAKGVDLCLVLPPLSQEALEAYAPEDIQAFLDGLTGIADFWDFTNTPLSQDQRFFYDSAHYKDAVGRLMAHKIFSGEDLAGIPSFGLFVKKGSPYTVSSPKGYVEEKVVKAFMLHHISPDADGTKGPIISPEKFEEVLQAIQAGGYTTVTVEEVRAYVEGRGFLPEKPVILAFDDGYTSNYDYAYPLLKKYDMKAIISPIGSYLGKSTYKDTGEKIFPHFDKAAIEEMEASGHVEFGCHGYDIHQSTRYEGEGARTNILRFEGESEEDYIRMVHQDMALFKQALEGVKVESYAYPLGMYDPLSCALVYEAGYDASFTIEPGESTLVRGLPQSLILLKRTNIAEHTSLQDILP